MDIKISETIKALRKDRNLSQEQLAAATSVTVQAVSKWETGASLPDTLLLPKIAAFFEVSLDYLFFGTNQENTIFPLPDDGVLRVVQFLGSRLLLKQEIPQETRMQLELKQAAAVNDHGQTIHIEIWGNADIKGNISGGVNAGGSISCDGNLSGGANAGDGISCGGSISGGANAVDGISCGGSISGGANAGDGISCGSSISGGANAGDGISCGSGISGDVSAGGNLNCTEVGGNVECQGDIHCREIKGEVHCDGNIIYEKQ